MAPPGRLNSVDADQSPQTDFVSPTRDLNGNRIHWLRRLLAFIGPGFLVAVGYMDPGNWATDLAGGSAFGYSLLWVILLSNLMAIFLQILAARLGIVTGMDLAQACRRHYSKPVSIALWLLCEVAICATDLAEVIGTAIALNLLFGIPLLWGVSLTIVDVLLVLWLQQRGFRYLEAVIMSLLAVIFICIAYNVFLAQPEWGQVARGFVPNGGIFSNPTMLYIAIGIIGATVMPHNLYLHSSTVQTRRYSTTQSAKRDILRFVTADVVIALLFAFVVNASILIVSAGVFHVNGHTEVAEIQDAYHLLAPIVGTSLASTFFGLALLASGQSSTLTATLAGQIVMEGFVDIRLPPWARRLITRAIAIVPAFLVTLYFGESGTAQLLILSQVILSLQLPFAVVPLVRFTSDKKLMGGFVNARWAVVIACLVAGVLMLLNGVMLFNLFTGAS